MELPRIEVPLIGLDYETDGLQYWQPDFHAFGVAVSTADNQWYFDIRDTPGLAHWLRDLLPGKIVVSHSAQFEYQVTRTFGIDPRSIKQWRCTMVTECLLNEHHFEYNLEAVAGHRGIASKKSHWLDRMVVAMGLRTHAEVLARLRDAPRDLVSQYGSSDARLCFDIWQSQKAEIDKEDMWYLVDLESRLLPVLADMSYHGVRVNREAAEAAIPKLDAAEREIAVRIAGQTGCKNPSVFVNSPKQMREFFKPEPINKYQWKTIDGTLVGPTKGGKSGALNPSLDQKALQAMQHPVAKDIQNLRKTIKLRDTFLRGHVLGSADANGYVHTTFHQARSDDNGAISGRIQASDPALQQITKRDKENAAILRSLFLPDEGQEWFCADYAQVDFRCGAHLQNIPAIIQAYWADPSLDYHQIVADMTGIPRNAPYAGAPYAKQINLGLSFGAGAGKLAFMMGMPHELTEYRGKMAYIPGPEAKKVFDTYHAKLPGVKEFMKYAESVAKTRGYVKTLTGRRLRFPSGGEHKAAGLLYQAYAADLHKIGLIRVDDYLRSENYRESGSPARLMVSVHDELGASISPNSRLRAGILREYTDFNSDTSWIRMRIPITASGDSGINWWEASKG